MEKKKLKQILLKYYSEPGMFAILNGTKKPRYEIMYKLNKEHKIPFDVWINIKSYLENDTKKQSCNTTTA